MADQATGGVSGVVVAAVIAMVLRAAGAMGIIPLHFVPHQFLFVLFHLVWLHPHCYARVVSLWGVTSPPKPQDKTQQSQARGARWLHLALAFFGTMVLVHAYPATSPAPPPGWLVLGFAVQSVGIALAFWSRNYLAEFWRGTPAIREGHRLITTGPYRWVRHPIYTSFLFQCLGAWLAAQSWYSLAGLALIAGIYAYKAAIEERMLAAAFSAEHTAWCRRTPWQLVPLIY
jgi:protein-S-isoprenylcysteine O-methyltransferase Ste14